MIIVLKHIASTPDKILFLLRGPSGSGKSFLGKQLAKKYNIPESKIRSTDKWHFDPMSGKYKFDPAMLKIYHLKTQQQVAEDMKQGEPIIIVDNTNIQYWQMKPYVALALRFGYKVKFVEPNWEDVKLPDGRWNIDALIRNQKNKDRAGKNLVVPENVIKRMVALYEYNPTVESVLNSEEPIYL